jgi:hypothetical protein
MEKSEAKLGMSVVITQVLYNPILVKNPRLCGIITQLLPNSLDLVEVMYGDGEKINTFIENLSKYKI